MHRSADVQMHELARRLDPVDRLCPEKDGALGRTHDQAVTSAYSLTRIHFLQQRQHAPSGASPRRARGGRDRPFHGLPEPVLIHRLQQVIEGVNLECPDCILIVSGHEDDGRLVRFSQSRYHFEAIETRHLDVEQHHVGCMLANGLHCLFAVRTCGDYFRIRLGLEQPHEALASDRFVIGHDDSQCHPTSSSRSRCESGTGVWAASQWVNGRRSVATVPPPAAGSSVKWARDP
jgi:hypothetical protein